MPISRLRISIFNKEGIHRGALRPCGARPKASPMLSLLNILILSLDMGILCMILRIFIYVGLKMFYILCPEHIPLHPENIRNKMYQAHFGVLQLFTNGNLHNFANIQGLDLISRNVYIVWYWLQL